MGHAQGARDHTARRGRAPGWHRRPWRADFCKPHSDQPKDLLRMAYRPVSAGTVALHSRQVAVRRGGTRASLEQPPASAALEGDRETWLPIRQFHSGSAAYGSKARRGFRTQTLRTEE